MEDTPQELNSHLEFMLKAKDKVLVTGLGLGCVIRGMLANGEVEHVTCIERSKDVIGLVAPFMDMDKIEIVQEDALSWVKDSGSEFDCAYHDLWTDRDAGEPMLQMQHTRLVHTLGNRVRFQGAWGIPRSIRRYIKQKFSFGMI